MKTKQTSVHSARPALGLILGLLLCHGSVQAQINNWVGASTSSATKSWNSTANWSLGHVPASGDTLVFGFNQSPGNNNTLYGTRSPVNSFTNYSYNPISIVFTNTDGWRIGVNGATNFMTLGAAGILQDASVTNTTPAGTATVGRNEFYNYFVLNANSSIVNNSTNSFINIRQDAAMYLAGNFFCLDNNGKNLTFDGSGAITFQAPNTGSHAGGAIKGSGGLIKNGLGVTSLSSSNAYTGSTMVNAGQLAIYTYSYGGGSYGVSNNASLNVRVAAAGSTLNTSSLALTNTTGAANTNTLGFNLSNLGNPTAPVIYATNLTVNGTVYVTVAGTGLSPGTINLIKYNGSVVGGGSLVTNSLPAGVVGYLTNNTSAQAIQLVVSQVPSLLWVGTTSVWDIGGTVNWLDTSTASPATFLNGLAVSFDDTATSKIVTVSSNVSPFSITVSNSLTYNFTNNGTTGNQIAGAARLIKDGSGTLVMGVSNVYSGFTSIKNGTVKLAVNQGLSSNSVLTNNATLDLNGFSQTVSALNGSGVITNSTAALGGATNTLTVDISSADAGTFAGQINDGAGKVALIKGNGGLTMSGNNKYSGGTTITATGGSTALRVLLLAGNNVLGTGPLNWSVGCTLQSADATPRTLTNAIFLNTGASPTLGNAGSGPLTLSGPVNLQSTADESLVINSAVVFSGPTFTSTPGSGGIASLTGSGTLTLKSSSCNWSNLSSTLYQHDGNVVIDGGNLAVNNTDYRIEDQGASGITRLVITNGGSLTISTTNKDLKIGYTSSTPTSTNIADIAGTLNVARYVQVGAGGGALGVLNVNAGGKIITAQIRGGGTPGVVNLNGGTLQPNGDSSTLIATVSNVFVLAGGVIIDTDTNGVHITQDLLNGGGGGGLVKLGTATLQLDGTNTYTGTTTISNGTLAGVGVVSGPVVITAGGSFKPANVNVIGTFTVSNSLTFQAGSSIGMDVAKDLSPSNDVAIVTGALTYGGTLSPTTNLNVTSSFVAGDTFRIFPPGGSGNFSAISGSPGPGLAWSFSPATGILSVVVPSSAPPTLGVSISGSVLTFTWTDATFHLQAQTNSLSAGLRINWANYPGGTTSPVNVTINPANPTVFFRLSQ